MNKDGENNSPQQWTIMEVTFVTVVAVILIISLVAWAASVSF